MNKTNGYLSLEGKIKFFGAKSLKDSPRSKKIIFAIETIPENVIGVEGFGFKKDDTDEILVNLPDRSSKKIAYADREWLEEGETLVGVSVKKDKADKAVTLVDIDAVEFIAANFKNGDSVFVNLKAEADSYWKNLKYTITKIYPTSNPINFDSVEFSEVNHGVQWAIFDGVSGNLVNTYLIGKNDFVLPLVFELSPDIAAENFAQFNAGDAIYLDYELIKTPVYKEVEATVVPEKTGFTPVGKYKDAPTGGGSKFKTVEKYIEKYICVGIKDVKPAEVKIEDVKKAVADDTEVPF